MSNFQASIINGNGQTDVLLNNGVLTLGDDSNYFTNTENACGATLFNTYRTYSVTYYQGSVYNLSSIFSPPTCKAWYGGPNPSINLNTGDGWYSVVMSTLPNWNSGSSYTGNVHQVWNTADQNVYSCIATNVGMASTRPDISTGLWTKVVNANPIVPLSTQIFSKYQAQAYFAVLNNSMICLPSLISNALCAAGLGCNNATLCGNDNFINALKALLCIYSIENANASNQLQFTTNTFDLLNQLCGCNSTN